MGGKKKRNTPRHVGCCILLYLSAYTTPYVLAARVPLDGVHATREKQDAEACLSYPDLFVTLQLFYLYVLNVSSAHTLQGLLFCI